MLGLFCFRPMTPAQVLVRIDELMQIARARIDASPHKPGQSYAEIAWLTIEEAQELLQLRISLPTYKQERDAAMQRLREKRLGKRDATATK